MASRYDKRLDKLENIIATAGALPKSARGPYLIWRDPDSTEEDMTRAETRIKKRLVGKHGTSAGARFFSVGWDTKSQKENAQS